MAEDQHQRAEGYQLANVRIKERCRRQAELLNEAREGKLKSEGEKNELLICLTHRIHSLQVRKDVLDDEQAARVMHGLFVLMERFVQLNFGDAAQLNSMDAEFLPERALASQNTLFHSKACMSVVRLSMQ